MDCMQIKDRLVQYIEGLLTEEEKALMDNHLSECNDCHREIRLMMEIHERLILSARQNRSADLEGKVFNRIVCEQNKRLKETLKPNPRLEYWRSIMKSRVLRISAATAIVFAAIIGITLFNKSEPIATAQDVLADAVKATAGLESIHMKGQIRTSPGSLAGNFDLNHDFVPVEAWKKTDQEDTTKWRLETTGSLIITDGKTATIFNAVKNSVYKYDEPEYPDFNLWMMRLLDVHKALDSELRQAKDNPFQQIRLMHKGINGKDKIVLEVNAWANPPPGGDPAKNKILIASDHKKVYQFDTDTKLLEGLKIYLIVNGQEVLVFETIIIEYNALIDDSVFIPDLPYDVGWSRSGPQILPDNDKYAKMTPKEVAAAFFDAASKEDWNEMLKLSDVDGISQKDKDKLADLEVIYLCEPVKFQVESGPLYWVVSYKIKFKNGDMREDKLGLCNDNKAKRYVVLGTL